MAFGSRGGREDGGFRRGLAARIGAHSCGEHTSPEFTANQPVILYVHGGGWTSASYSTNALPNTFPAKQLP